MRVSVLVCVAFLVISSIAITTTPRTPKSLTYNVRQHNQITIPIMFHLDVKLTKKLTKQHSFKTRKKLKNLVKAIVRETTMLFKKRSLNQTVNLKLLDIKFIRNEISHLVDENASRYLRNYCEWQSMKKIKNKKHYYSVMLTGMDLFHVKNGRAVRGTTARSYTNGVCSLKKSCALIEWQPKLTGYLLAHEIAHSLGVRHDGQNNCENYKGIMESKYDPTSTGDTWSLCSRKSFESFMRSDKSWCLKNPNRNFKYTYKKT